MQVTFDTGNAIYHTNGKKFIGDIFCDMRLLVPCPYGGLIEQGENYQLIFRRSERGSQRGRKIIVNVQVKLSPGGWYQWGKYKISYEDAKNPSSFKKLVPCSVADCNIGDRVDHNGSTAIVTGLTKTALGTPAVELNIGRIAYDFLRKEQEFSNHI
jgi:hypothetical protein